jgi:LPS-assembly protein
MRRLLADRHTAATRTRPTRHGSMGILVSVALAPGAALHAQALMCPAGAVARNATSISGTQSRNADNAKLPIQLEADSWEVAPNGDITLTGKADAKQGSRSVRADGLFFNPNTRELAARGTVSYDDPLLLISSNDANLHSDGSADLVNADFLLKSTAGHGKAQLITLNSLGNLSLDNVSYTSCPPESVGWELKLSDLDINQATQTGTGRNVRLLFGGVPIFYSPWLSFPVGDQRKSGFLFPAIGSSSRGGTALSVPWYWNLATNYDDTITPSIDTARGFKLDNEFRYLGEHSKGQLLTGYLPHDNLTGDWRGWAALDYRNDLTSTLRFDIAAQDVRDTTWFEDFGQGRDVTSLVYLNRQTSFSYYSNFWRATLDLQQLQTLDTTIAEADRPYTRLPALTLSGEQPLPLGAEFKLDSELAYFTRGDLVAQIPSVTGARWYAAPTLSWPLRGPGIYFTPSVGWRYTGYALKNTDANDDSHPSVSAPVYSIDTGLIFERLSNSSTRLYTLEPRLLYSYVPYRNQTALKTVFDTTLVTADQGQLFETSRFVGPDRLGDANELSAGVTTRMMSTADGTQYLSGTLGQVYYFTSPCITSLVSLTCNDTSTGQSSDVFAQLSLTRYRNLSLSFGTQWSPQTQRSSQSSFSAQYRRDGSHVLNLSYRFVRDSDIKQWEASGAWPITQSISGYGRVVYSQFDRKFLDHFAGLEYRSCCWNIRAVVGRAVTTRSGEFDTQFKLQLELKGLSSVGTADSFLQSSISGYSATGE